jgi:hypothetical protein
VPREKKIIQRWLLIFVRYSSHLWSFDIFSCLFQPLAAFSGWSHVRNCLIWTSRGGEGQYGKKTAQGILFYFFRTPLVILGTQSKVGCEREKMCVSSFSETAKKQL